MALSLREAIARTAQRLREDTVIESRAELLPPADRDLLLAVWIYQQPTGMVARMRGLSPAAVRRRIRILIHRLHSQEFIGAARAMRLLSDVSVSLPTPDAPPGQGAGGQGQPPDRAPGAPGRPKGLADFARLHFCHGLSVRQAARAMDIGYHQARQMACQVRALMRLQGER